MPDLFANASTWLAAKLKTHASQSITARRGSKAIGSGLKATYGATTFEQDSEFGLIRWESKDFLIPAADYTIGGVPVDPERGDVLIDDKGNEFQVLGDDGLPCFKYTDGHRTQLRIHTKQVGE